MKKLIIAVLLVGLLTVPLMAEGISLLPDLASSSWITMYDCQVHNLKTGLRYPALGWKFFYVDGQVITDMDALALAIGLGIEIVEFGRWVGLNVFLNQNFNIGFNFGYNFKAQKPIWGPWGGVNIKF